MALALATDALSVPIASGDNLSAALALGGATPIGVQMDPTAWTAAVLTFQVSVDGATFQDAYTSAGVEISVTVAAQHYVVLPATLLPGVRFLKVRSGTAGSPVAQAGDRALTLLTRGL